MTTFKAERNQAVATLFKGHLGGHIPPAILEGHMGRIIADQADPTFAALELPEVKFASLGGNPNHPLARHYLQNLPRFSMLTFASDDLVALAQAVHPGKWIDFERQAFSTEQLDIAKLREFKTHLPDRFRVEKIDVALAKQFTKRKNKFARFHGATFNSPHDFVERGFGFCALEGERIACVASSFTICDQGIEIQIDTKKKYKGKGVATAVAAHLIVHCLENDLDPGWDAATKVSESFAKKLGYTPQGSYKMFIFTGSKFLVSLRDNIRRLKRFLNK